MPEATITTKLAGLDEFKDAKDDRPTMIKVDHISMEFNMASEKLGSLKEYAIALAKRKLFFESFMALDDISLEVKKGDVFGILGTNGSGKSTLLKIIAGVLEPTKGSVEVKGNIAPLIELGAGFDMELSARENIFLNGALLGYPKEFIDEHFDDIVSFAEVEKFLDMPMKNYSSGMISRIAFAIATVIVPEILIVDEVLSVGDFMFQQKCEDRITELIEKHGVTVLIVSHSNDQIERLCNKAIWVEKGHTRIEGDADIVCDAYRVLGGRTGSVQSEQAVYNALCRAKRHPVLPRDAKRFCGSSYLEISSNAALEVWDEDACESVLLAPGHTHVFGLTATGIAGALGAPLLPISIDGIPPETLNALTSLNPSDIYVVAKEQTVRAVSEDRRLLSLSDRIIPVPCGSGCIGIWTDVVEFGIKHSLIDTNVAFVSSFEEPLFAFCFGPLAFKRHIPFLTTNPSDLHDDEEFIAQARRLGFSKLFALGSMACSTVSDELERDGIEIVRIFDSDPIAYFSKAFQLSIDEGGLSSNSAMVVSSDQAKWQSLFAAGTTAGKLNMPLLFEDVTNLDSVAMCLEKTDKEMHSIAFMGYQEIMGLNADILSVALD